LALEQAQMSGDSMGAEEVLVPEKTYPEGAIVFPLPASRQ